MHIRSIHKPLLKDTPTSVKSKTKRVLLMDLFIYSVLIVMDPDTVLHVHPAHLHARVGVRVCGCDRFLFSGGDRNKGRKQRASVFVVTHQKSAPFVVAARTTASLLLLLLLRFGMALVAVPFVFVDDEIGRAHV